MLSLGGRSGSTFCTVYEGSLTMETGNNNGGLALDLQDVYWLLKFPISHFFVSPSKNDQCTSHWRNLFTLGAPWISGDRRRSNFIQFAHKNSGSGSQNASLGGSTAFVMTGTQSDDHVLLNLRKQIYCTTLFCKYCTSLHCCPH